MPQITLTLLPSPTEDARLLISELDAELNAEYPPEQRHGYPIDKIFQPHILFFIAHLNNQPAGCGAIAFSPEHDHAEVKRMYVRPSARGQGVASSLLSRLESEARSRQIPRLTLETGDIRLPAIQLYQRHGFSPCPPFPPYTDMPPAAIARSVFLEKQLR